MRTPTQAVLRCAAVAVLAALGHCGPPAANAVPPPVDHSRLPEPAPPAPPRPSVQRELCAVPFMEPGAGRRAASRQLGGLDLPQVWQLTRGAGQRVAVIDTGVSPHPRLPKTVAGGDYVFTSDGNKDCDGHGTVVAGIIAAATDPNHGDNFSGVAPDVTLIAIRQSSTKFGPLADPSSTGFGDVDTLAKAVRTAADLGASVINVSSVACVPTGTTLDDRALGAALAYAVDVKDAVVVAAAGNSGSAGQCVGQHPTTVTVSPAWYDDYVLTVASVNAHDEPSSFTLPGPWVDVAARGEEVLSLSPFDGGTVTALDGQGNSTPLSGTSYAAPVVSGLAALIRARFPTLTARQVMQRIKATAHHPPDGWDPLVGNGVVDILAAVSSDAPPSTVPRPHDAAVPVAPTVPPTPPPLPDRGARRTAFTGAAICLAVLAAALAAGAVTTRLRRGRTQPDSGAD